MIASVATPALSGMVAALSGPALPPLFLYTLPEGQGRGVDNRSLLRMSRGGGPSMGRRSSSGLSLVTQQKLYALRDRWNLSR